MGSSAYERASNEAPSLPGVIGYVPGVFDMFHIGHLNILRHARRHCDYLIAGVVSDENAAAAKGRMPIVPLIERLEIVGQCKLVDRAVAESVPSKLEMWESLKFHVIFKGDDWRGTSKGEALESMFRQVGVDVVYFPYTIHTSSSILRNALGLVRSNGSGKAAQHRVVENFSNAGRGV